MPSHFWSAAGQEPVAEWSWFAAAGVAAAATANVLRAVSSGAEMGAALFFAAANAKTSKRLFHEQASAELEALTSGAYWEVETEAGVYVAGLDEYEEDEESDDDCEDE